MDHISKWNVYCQTESNMLSTWRAFKPVRCPNNPNHTIDASQTIKLDDAPIMLNEETVANRVTIDAKAYAGTNGYYQCRGYEFEMLQGESNVTHDIVMPYTSCQYGISICAQESNVNDKLDIIVNPNTLVGVLTANASNGDSNIFVNQTVVQNVIPGFYLTVGDQSNYLVTTVCPQSNAVQLEHALSNTTTAMTPLYVNAYIAKDLHICSTNPINIGYGGMGGKTLVKGSMVRVEYSNSNMQSKCLYVRTETNY